MSDKKIMYGDQDITEGVQILYDIAHSSMNWGSGMLDNEEMMAVVQLAVDMGWRVPSLPDNSTPILNVAKAFPDHYEIIEQVAPGVVQNGVEVLAPRKYHRIRIKS